MAPYVSISSVASASYSFEGILGENKNITSEKEREIAEMRTQFSIPVASWKYLYKLPPLTKWDHVFIGILNIPIATTQQNYHYSTSSKYILPALPGYPNINHFRSILPAVNNIIPGICLEKCVVVNDECTSNCQKHHILQRSSKRVARQC